MFQYHSTEKKKLICTGNSTEMISTPVEWHENLGSWLILFLNNTKKAL